MKQIAYVLGCVVILFVLVTAIRLSILYTQVDRYSRYWTNEREKADATPRRLIVLGDSSAQGIGASRPERSYVGLLQSAIQEKTGQPTGVINLSVSGATIADVSTKQLPELSKLTITKQDIVIMSVGGNDIIRNDPAHFAADFAALLDALPSQIIIADVAYFGGGRYRSHEPAVLTANQSIHDLASKKGVDVVPLHRTTQAREVIWNHAADLLHPSDHGYKNWFDAFWQVVEKKL